MVTRIVNSNGAGDLRNAGDFFGVEHDNIYVLAAGGPIFTGAGDDVVDASQAPNAYFQIAILGSGNDRYYGGGGTDLVRDGQGNDYVTLGGGDDTVSVGIGNDTYIGGDGLGRDTVQFILVPTDDDTVFANYSPVSFDLAKTTAQSLGIFGTDTFSGFENVHGSFGSDALRGSSGANDIRGQSGNDLLDGRGGADDLFGGDGNDTIFGRAGNDVIEGGGNADVMRGGAGKDMLCATDGLGGDSFRDRFVFAAISDSGPTESARDVVWDFVKNAGAIGDRIDLHLIDADRSKAGNQAFKFGTAFHSDKMGEVRVVKQGADSLIRIDIDRDAGSEMTILVHGVHLTASDFIL